jgi:23S rRNA (cytosine1962-C5)-methyltransferase
MTGDIHAGDIVEILRSDGKFLGLGFCNPHSLIAARFLTKERESIDFGFFERRITDALNLRTRVYPDAKSFRLVHGESDFLPGLIVDKYNECFAIQTLCYGMDLVQALICDVLEQLFHPKGIVERNETPLRRLEGLPQRSGILRGDIRPTVVDDGQLRYKVDVLHGQKTGYYLDQRENRKLIRRFAKDCRVLDCFCYEGGFALNAASAGARGVIAIDESTAAIRVAEENALMNHLASVCHFEVGNVFERLKQLLAAEEQFDMIILDPPSFTKSKKNILAAKKGYREINTDALRLLKRGGILATASCSYHIEQTTFLDVIFESAQKAGRLLRMLEWRGASPDHPILLAMPETSYLKFGVFVVE